MKIRELLALPDPDVVLFFEPLGCGATVRQARRSLLSLYTIKDVITTPESYADCFEVIKS